MSNDDYQAGECSGRLTGLSASIKALLKLIISEFSKYSATYTLMGVLRELKLESNLLDQLGRQHTLHEIWLETPVRIINYYPYEKNMLEADQTRFWSLNTPRRGGLNVSAKN